MPAGTPVLSGPGQPLVVGLGVGLGAGELGKVGVGLGKVGDGLGKLVGETVGLGELVGHFGFGTHDGRMPRP